MPIYEYQCQSCGFLFDELQSMKEEPLIKCPNCGKNELKKLIGSGSSVIFKGSGFYQTDYKKKHVSSGKTGSSSTPESSGTPSAAESKGASVKTSNEKKSESKKETGKKK
jgi:putative FmdB family regulatory protein